MSNYQSYQPYQPDSSQPYASAPYDPAGQPYAPVEPYGAAYAAPRPEHPRATTILVLGILGFVTSGILGPVAWAMGNTARRECAAGQYTMTDSLRIGRMLGIITTILLIIGIVLIVIMVAAGLLFAAGGAIGG
ncbi:MAG: hypothetical protein LBI33_01395 [Propionibacteriaceae bacterium]|jgi:hypothetical protein|nr:hypothetical protein [Propionibacteriaceae bacterium]